MGQMVEVKDAAMEDVVTSLNLEESAFGMGGV